MKSDIIIFENSSLIFVSNEIQNSLDDLIIYSIINNYKNKRINGIFFKNIYLKFKNTKFLADVFN